MTVFDTVFKTRWNAGRIIRVVLGLAFLADAFYKDSWAVALMGFILLVQGLLNFGCGMKSCGPSTQLPAKNLPDLSKTYRKL